MSIEFNFDKWYKLANNNLYLTERAVKESILGIMLLIVNKA
jgi:hypothetical protein